MLRLFVGVPAGAKERCDMLRHGFKVDAGGIYENVIIQSRSPLLPRFRSRSAVTV